MKPINFSEIQSLQKSKQYFHDCYLISSINALSKCENGIQILHNNICRDGNNFKIKFNDVNGKSEDFFVSEKEIKNLILCDKYLNPIQVKENQNPIIKALEIAMNKLIAKYPNKKSFANRLYKSNEKFEYNNPSRFMEMFTRIKPININENGIRMTLNSNAEEAINTFKRIGESKDTCFIVGTGQKFLNDLPNWHCYTIEQIDNLKKLIQLFDSRQHKSITINFEDAIKKLKFITGYFSEDLT